MIHFIWYICSLAQQSTSDSQLIVDLLHGQGHSAIGAHDVIPAELDEVLAKTEFVLFVEDTAQIKFNAKYI